MTGALSFRPLSFILSGCLTIGLSFPGCSPDPIQPDKPLPFPGMDLGQAPDAGVSPDLYLPFETSPDLAPEIAPCLPDPCLPGVIDKDRGGPGMGLCISFSEEQDAAALATAGKNSGLSVVDLDQDGKPDLYLLKGGQPNRMFKNQGGTFADISKLVGLNIGGDSRDAVWGDYDGDKKLDLFLVGAGGSRLYRNDGGVFQLVSSGGAGIEDMNPGKAAVWLGVDLFLATENGTRFYKNLGGDNFQEMAAQVGLDDPGEGVALAVADYDGDGLQDVYLANSTGKNRLFRRQNSGIYVPVETETKTEGGGNSTDAQWVSFQGENFPSLYVSNFDGGNQLYVNQQDGGFIDQAGILGVRDPGQTTTVAWADFLNEQRPALFLGRWGRQNLLYVPTLSGASKIVTGYMEMAYPLGMAVTRQTLKSAWLDYDQDGKQDLLVIMADGGLSLYHNKTNLVKICPEEQK